MATETLETPQPAAPDVPAEEAPVSTAGAGDISAEQAGALAIEKELTFLRLDENTPAAGLPEEVPAEAAANEQPPQPPRSWKSTLAGMPLKALLTIVLVLDFPVALLGPRLRPLIGYIAIGTAVIATATWIAGPRLAAAASNLP